jgi:hypothetical protein
MSARTCLLPSGRTQLTSKGAYSTLHVDDGAARPFTWGGNTERNASDGALREWGREIRAETRQGKAGRAEAEARATLRANITPSGAATLCLAARSTPRQ